MKFIITALLFGFVLSLTGCASRPIDANVEHNSCVAPPQDNKAFELAARDSVIKAQNEEIAHLREQSAEFEAADWEKGSVIAEVCEKLQPGEIYARLCVGN